MEQSVAKRAVLVLLPRGGLRCPPNFDQERIKEGKLANAWFDLCFRVIKYMKGFTTLAVKFRKAS